jgi:prevent-host-death family protein
MKSSSIRISATEASRNLSDLLNRVRYRGERFTIVRGGEEVAEILPPAKGGVVVTLGELRGALASVPAPDDAFVADLERIRDEQPPAEPSWPS